MEVNPNFIAPCGLYCGVCGVYYATRDNNKKFFDKLIGVYKGKIPGSENLEEKDIHCEGCLSGKTSIFCTHCKIRDCAQEKGYQGCHQCDDFPCEHIDNFPMPVGKKVIHRAIPYWKEHGTIKWVTDEEARYHCPECGHKIFRGAKRCNKCKTAVDLD